MTGRGAWPNSGAGGTKAYKDASAPGPYYFIGSGRKPEGRTRNDSERAVHLAVKAYQRALNRRIGSNIEPTGVYTDVMAELVKDFQTTASGLTAWGGIGPDTSKALLKPDIKNYLPKTHPQITADIVSGTINTESMWDAGAVGYLDDHDLGLAQINGPAHPNLSVVERFQPKVAYEFVVDYYINALGQLNNNIEDSIASYNLGIGGAKRWIGQGRPTWYTPAGGSRPRNVREYIDKILAG